MGVVNFKDHLPAGGAKRSKLLHSLLHFSILLTIKLQMSCLCTSKFYSSLGPKGVVSCTTGTGTGPSSQNRIEKPALIFDSSSVSVQAYTVTPWQYCVPHSDVDKFVHVHHWLLDRCVTAELDRCQRDVHLMTEALPSQSDDRLVLRRSSLCWGPSMCPRRVLPY